MRWPWRRTQAGPIEPRRVVRSKALEQETAKKILAEVLLWCPPIRKRFSKAEVMSKAMNSTPCIRHISLRRGIILVIKYNYIIYFNFFSKTTTKPMVLIRIKGSNKTVLTTFYCS